MDLGVSYEKPFSLRITLRVLTLSLMTGGILWNFQSGLLAMKLYLKTKCLFLGVKNQS